MLPANLEALRVNLSGLSHRNVIQESLLNELNTVSKSLEAEGLTRTLLHEELRNSKLPPAAWGGAPGRCHLCGR